MKLQRLHLLSIRSSALLGLVFAVLLLPTVFTGPALGQCPGGGTDYGTLKVNGSAAIVGNCGLQVVIEDQSSVLSFVRDTNPQDEADYWVRFYFDPNTANLTTTKSVKLLDIKSNSPVQGIATVFFLSLRKRGFGAFELFPRAIKNNGTHIGPDPNSGWDTWQVISDGPHLIEIHWYQASTATRYDGGFEFWVDGVKTAERTNAQNGSKDVDYIQFGIITPQLPAGSSGSFLYDAFSSARTGPIGPAS